MGDGRKDRRVVVDGSVRRFLLDGEMAAADDGNGVEGTSLRLAPLIEPVKEVCSDL